MHKSNFSPQDFAYPQKAINDYHKEKLILHYLYTLIYIILIIPRKLLNNTLRKFISSLTVPFSIRGLSSLRNIVLLKFCSSWKKKERNVRRILNTRWIKLTKRFPSDYSLSKRDYYIIKSWCKDESYFYVLSLTSSTKINSKYRLC